MPETVKLGVAVGLVRGAAFVLGSIALGASGFVQVVGYVAALWGLPEILLVRGLRPDPVAWRAAGGVVVLGGSVAWVGLLRWGVRRWSRRRQGSGPA